MRPGYVPPTDPLTAKHVARLTGRGARRSVLKVVLFLGRTCVRYGRSEIYPRQSTIARETGLGNSTVRVALTWLEGRGEIGRSDATIGGEARQVIRCPWLDPLLGRPEGPIPPGLPGPRRRTRAVSCAQKTAPNNSSELNSEDEKTTTDADAGEVVVVVPAVLEGGGEEGPQVEADPTPTPEGPPAAPLDPEVARAIEEHFPAAADRSALAAKVPGWKAACAAELAAKVPGWTAACAVEWIVLTILQMAVNRKKKPIHSPADYADSILARWRDDGRPTLRGVRRPPRAPEAVRADRDEEVGAKEAARRAEAEVLAREAGLAEDLKARWDGLPTFDREAIKGRVGAANPGLKWDHIMMPLCYAAMDGPPAASEAVPAPEGSGPSALETPGPSAAPAAPIPPARAEAIVRAEPPEAVKARKLAEYEATLEARRRSAGGSAPAPATPFPLPDPGPRAPGGYGPRGPMAAKLAGVFARIGGGP